MQKVDISQAHLHKGVCQGGPALEKKPVAHSTQDVPRKGALTWYPGSQKSQRTPSGLNVPV